MEKIESKNKIEDNHVSGIAYTNQNKKNEKWKIKLKILMLI